MTSTADNPVPPRAAAWSGPWPFFAFVFAWSWSFWFAAAASGSSAQSVPGGALEFAGLLGPMLGGIGFAYLTRGTNGRRDYWRRLFDARRIGPRWYAVVFLLPPALWGVVLALDAAAGGGAAVTEATHRLTSLVASPTSLLSFVLWTVFFGPVPEEMGWRGYVLDRLQERGSALKASLVLGAVWAVYHLPLFYIRGTYHAAQGAWSIWFWLFMVQVVALTVVFTWIFNNTRRSTLAAILFHFMLNVSAQVANVTFATNCYSTAVWIMLAAGIVAVGGAATLARRPSVQDMQR